MGELYLKPGHGQSGVAWFNPSRSKFLSSIIFLSSKIESILQLAEYFYAKSERLRSTKQLLTEDSLSSLPAFIPAIRHVSGAFGLACEQNVLHNCPTKVYNNANEYFEWEGVLIMNVSEAIAKRKSVRAYEDKPIPADVLKRIVEAGQWAPNAGPFQISVIRNTGLRQRINDRALDAMVHSGNAFAQQRASLPGYQPIYGAPVLILLSAPADAPFGPANTALAAENMLLEATGLGLGSCYLVSPTRALNG
jgi:hypothetical protein